MHDVLLRERDCNSNKKMLAEPKYKLKWADDPRNINWANDTSKYGYKMLSKMGWSEGKGLGAQENGTTSHVKVSKRRENLGLGASTFHEDNWLAHQDDFSALLSKLNQQDGKGNEDSKQTSLQNNVQNSQRKILYSKFIKSKDLSSKSKNDLACVFGQRSKSTPATPQELSEDEGSKSDASIASCPERTTESGQEGFVTVRSEMNLQEYFASKMAALKQKSSSKSDTRPSEVKEVESSASEDGKDKKVKKRKKEKKDKRQEDEMDDGIRMKRKKDKKKRKKCKESLCCEESNLVDLEEVVAKDDESGSDEGLVEPKKKKVKLVENFHENGQQRNGAEKKKDGTKDSKLQKLEKRDKSGKSEETAVQTKEERKEGKQNEHESIDRNEKEEKKSKKKKKKNKRSQDDKEPEYSKKKKEKDEVEDKEASNIELMNYDESCKPKKKKKKSLK